MLKKILENFDIPSFKEDFRKIGINFITAGTVGLFVTHIAALTFYIVATSFGIVFSGVVVLLLGLYRRKHL
jgi:hypothetical protein